ncbi:hypothetical protein KAU55_02830 [Candidatus Bathyarchaeota archaeon]|nr:hypothetical protein [Candidatus Bathyarchaeota archaeon]
MNENKKNDIMLKIGILLGVLGGAMAILESCIVLAYTSGGYGLIGLTVAILILATTIIIYKGSRLLGAIIMFFSSLIGQLIGGAVGLVLVVITSPPPSPVFNETFAVSSWTMLSLLGSILILFVIWKSRGE